MDSKLRAEIRTAKSLYASACLCVAQFPIVGKRSKIQVGHVNPRGKVLLSELALIVQVCDLLKQN